MATDSSLVRPADLFYNSSDVEEPVETVEEEIEPTETESVANEDVDPEEIVHEDGADDSEESAELDDDVEEDDNEELVYLELDGKEVNLEDVRKWRDGHLMQSDYTRKTTELAEQRKELSAAKSQIQDMRQQLETQVAELLALVESDEKVDWEELRELDPEAYIDRKEKADERKRAADKFKGQLKSQPTLTQDELKQEQKQLFQANPSWINDKGETTDDYKADMETLTAYWQKSGFTSDEINSMVRSRYIETCLKAAKFDQLNEKSKKVIKKARKATLVTKTKAQTGKAKQKPKSAADLFYNS